MGRKSKLFFTLLICLFIVSNVLALCESEQIDINSASLEKLDELTGIGPVKAQAIIDSRPFNFVDDLINVYGIGEVTLEKIKEQGLACVEEEIKEKSKEKIEEEEKEIEEEPEEEITEEVEKKEKDEEKKQEIIGKKVVDQEENIELKTINLNAQSIKSEDATGKPSGSNYFKYGFAIFCFLLGIVLVLRKRKNYKTEFEK